MICMQGVSSALILRNESWVRAQASAITRRIPSNVEKADLIQVGLIGVTQAALSFVWAGDRESAEAREAFVRYAQKRVKGAMLDELRQMDRLTRSQRRKVKVVQIARARNLAFHGVQASLGELSTLCGMSVDEISKLEQAALEVESVGLAEESGEVDEFEHRSLAQPATPKDEVEARVDTAIVMRRLEKFFGQIPERERQVIDAYFGIGLTPSELASSLDLSESRIYQIYRMACDRIAVHLGQDKQRVTDQHRSTRETTLDALVDQREIELTNLTVSVSWPQLIERTLNIPGSEFGVQQGDGRMIVDKHALWG